MNAMPRHKQPSPSITGFGARLAEFRRARNITQVQLAESTGTTQRAISYYENEAGYPPVDAIVRLADALGVSTDELLGMHATKSAKAHSEHNDPDLRRFWKKFQQIARLPEKDQRAVIRLVNSLAKAS